MTQESYDSNDKNNNDRIDDDYINRYNKNDNCNKNAGNIDDYEHNDKYTNNDNHKSNDNNNNNKK